MEPLVRSNGSIEGDEFVRLWHEARLREQNELAAWIEELQGNRVAAAHPDDGWVNRSRSEIYFAHPYFVNDVRVGSVVALGTPREHRFVRITARVPGHFLRSEPYWQFEHYSADSSFMLAR